jgi:hypothetical protein
MIMATNMCSVCSAVSAPQYSLLPLLLPLLLLLLLLLLLPSPAGEDDHGHQQA